jgi:hypothetical protein
MLEEVLLMPTSYGPWKLTFANAFPPDHFCLVCKEVLN